ncbi:MAG: hypothetical protein ACRD0N_06110 [Acidimicrobiales bacterium]
MSLFRTPPRPDPEGWAAVQKGTKDLPREVAWPQDQCTRCKTYGSMDFSTGKALCSGCSGQTVVQLASPVGLHERSTLELNA